MGMHLLALYQPTLRWTLLDSNANEILPHSAAGAISGDVQRNKAKINVSSLTNKDNTDITFTLHADAGDGCNPQWNTDTYFVFRCFAGSV